MEFDISIVIDRPPRVVFEFLALKDEFPQPEGSPVLVLDKTTDGPVQVGTRYIEVVRMLPFYNGEIFSEITRYEPFSHLEVDFVGPSMSGHLSYTFEPVGNGTRLIQQETLSFKGFLWIFSPLIKFFLSKQLLSRLDDIKREVESANPETNGIST